jgi:peroxiredoxin
MTLPATALAAPTVGDAAPPIRLPDLEGRMVDLAEFRGSDLAVLFWSPTCNFCRRLLPELTAWEAAPPDGAPKLLLVAGGSEEANRTLSLRAPVLLDPTFDTGQALGAHGTPSAVLIDVAGRIASEVATGASSVMALLNRGQAIIPGANGHARPPVAPIGTPAPSLRLPGLDGTEINLATLQGKRVLVLFWNSACPYCQRMLPDLRTFEAELAASDVQLLIVSAGSVEANRAIGLRSTIVLDDEFRTARDFRASGTPSAVLIDEAGNIASEIAVGATGVKALAQASLGVAAAPA